MPEKEFVQNGMPSHLFIEELKRKKEKGELSDSRVFPLLEESGELLEDISRRVSIEACLDPFQQEAVVDDYLEAVSEISQKDGPEKTYLLRERVRQIATFINSCRLSCSKCFNRQCDQRDVKTLPLDRQHS